MASITSAVFRTVKYCDERNNVSPITLNRSHFLRHPKCILFTGEGYSISRLNAKRSNNKFIVLAANNDESDDNVEELEAFLSGKKSKRKPSQTSVQEIDDFPKAKKKPVEEMTPFEKVVDSWLGEKGGLYWLNQLAWYSIIAIGFAWVVFRFVLPGIGLYELDAPLLPPAEAF